MIPRKTTTRVIFHHSLSPDVSADKIRGWHRLRGWDDIGYHYVVRADGSVEKGRAEKFIGSHAQGRNADSIGICLTGNFHRHPPTRAQIASAVGLYHGLCRAYWVGLVVEYHRDAGAENACPGPLLDRNELSILCDLNNPYRGGTK